MLGSLVAIRTPPDAWHRGVVADFPDLTIQLDGVLPSADGTGRHIASLRGAAAEPALHHLRDNGQGHIHLLYREGGHVQVRIRVPNCALSDALFRTGITPNFPAVLLDDQYYLFVVDQEDTLGPFVDRLNRGGLESRLLRRASALDGVHDLTHYQYEVLRRALEEGYYDRPRRSTLTELAGRVGVAKSTLSETMRSVERKAVQRRLNGRTPPGTLRRLASNDRPADQRTNVKNRDK